MGGYVYFLASDPAYGRELRKSDGTPAGTSLLVDLEPGPGSSKISNLTVAGDFLYFTSGDGGRLWRSDGTAGGTVSLDSVGSVGGGLPSSFAELTVMNGVLYFQGGSQLWRTDWTSGGTRTVKNIASSSSGNGPRRLTVVGNTLYFVADTLDAGSELWKTDGTESGTVMVKDIVPGATGGLVTSTVTTQLVGAGGLVFFAAGTPESGAEIWRSDGTEAGTILLKDIEPGKYSSYPLGLTAAGNQMFFIAENAASGAELWRSDGTPSGTVMQRELFAGSESGTVQLPGREDLPAAMGGVVYFSGRTPANGREFWRTDGTSAGTFMLKNIAPEPVDGGTRSSNPRNFLTLGSRVFFEAADAVTSQASELWVTDGTVAGTVPVRTLLGGVAVTPGAYLISPRETTGLLGDDLLFAGSTLTDGNELWKVNLKTGGASHVKSFQGANSLDAPSLGQLIAVGETIYFRANRAAEGMELWRTNGLGAPPVLVQDVLPGTASGSPSNLTPAGKGNELYFTARLTPEGTGLFKTDGTASSTALLKSYPEQGGTPAPNSLLMLGNRLLFTATTAADGTEVWTSDGTADGTIMVRDINPGSAGSGPGTLALAGGAVWFGAYAGTPEPEPGLWRTDGTAAGTVRLRPFAKKVNPNPAALTAIGNRLYFSAVTDTAGRELWRSDGLASNTVMVKDIATGVNDGLPAGRGLTALGNSVYFWAFQEGAEGGDNLWKSDGTSAGTVRVWTSSASGYPADTDYPPPVRCGNLLFMLMGTQATGAELWKSDGTTGGTGLVRDIFPGPASSGIAMLGQKDGILYFAATDDTHGRELWRSDGTEAGTFIVEDLRPGPDSSEPGAMVPIGNGILYGVEDDGTGSPGLRELIWPAMQGTGEIVRLPDQTLHVKFRGLRLREHAVDMSQDLEHWSVFTTLQPQADGTVDLPVPSPMGIRLYLRARDIALRPVP